MVVNFISPTIDYVILRVPSSSESDLRRPTVSVPFAIAPPRRGDAWVLAFHSSITAREDAVIYVEKAFICAHQGMFLRFSSELFRGDSGAAVVVENGQLVGLFIESFTATPADARSPRERAEEAVQIESAVAGMTELSITRAAVAATVDATTAWTLFHMDKGKIYKAISLDAIQRLHRPPAAAQPGPGEEVKG